MAHAKHMAAQALTKQAADWVARLSGQPGEADWLAFEAWLGGDDERRAAYDKALRLSLMVDREAVAFAALHPRPESKATDYATAKGERRNIVLADGTRIALNTDSRLSVVMRP